MFILWGDHLYYLPWSPSSNPFSVDAGTWSGCHLYWGLVIILWVAIQYSILKEVDKELNFRISKYLYNTILLIMFDNAKLNKTDRIVIKKSKIAKLDSI